MISNLLKFSRSIAFFLISAVFVSQIGISFAKPSQSHQSESNQYSSPQEKEYVETLKAAIKAATQGPATVPLIDQGSLTIPNNYLFIPTKEASAFMKANGNITGPEFVGLIFSRKDDLRWFITINFIKSGYLRDGDAEKWTADDLFKNLKEGNDEANQERIANGFPTLEIVGWIETPKYNASTHQLVWSILANDKDSSSEPIVNYNTYVLGREGYFKLDLVTPNSSITQDKFIVNKLLASLHYNEGKRYQDFSEGRDRVAEYGLAALITGVAAKKLGLLALAGAFLIKMWKLIILLPVIFWAVIKRIFKGKSPVEKSE